MGDEIPGQSALTIAEYERLAQRTNRFPQSSARPYDLPLLGLFGEAGSLLSVVKKHQRDEVPPDVYLAEVEEEVGDFLWYIAVVCSRSGVPLEKLFLEACNRPVRREAGIRFSDIQDQFRRTSRAPTDRLIAQLIALAADIGSFVHNYSHGQIGDDAERVEGNLLPIIKGLLRSTSAARVEIQSAAVENLHKTFDRWPTEPRPYPPLYDEEHKDPTERLPRHLKIRIEQRTRGKRVYVFQTCNEVNIGDPLTDNIRDEDNYRFHDVFHYAYAAILGWSPVTRALFRLKRKSVPALDENEDGARAILIEEGISTTVFNYAKNLRLLRGVERGGLSFDVLKMVRSFVCGYEVETAPYWLWEEAILSGFECFRYLVEHKSGLVTVDMTKRKIEIGPLR